MWRHSETVVVVWFLFALLVRAFLLHKNTHTCIKTKSALSLLQQADHQALQVTALGKPNRSEHEQATH
jgi:hypothetical protein